MNDEFLKNNEKDINFEELLEQIRDIRTSEKIMR
ncbi:MAG: virulence RhuM family protein [Epulopiscium sp.]|nr:virulence RhuM family protein [Candidatus Epulonipiscium sp.]